jgi:hypothetical protein
LARYAQFYSRIGFVHEFRPLSSGEVRQLLVQGWKPAGVTFPAISTLDAEAAAAIIRVTGGNFRLLDRLLTQMERIMRINDLALADSIFPVVILRGRPPIRPSFLAAPSPGPLSGKSWVISDLISFSDN